MLFTRCPECTTTFRVSDEALKKANGQVRCGRCASVFNAVVEQVSDGAAAPRPPGAEQPLPATPATEPAAALDAPAAEHSLAGSESPPEPPAPAVEPEPAPAASAATAAPAPSPPAPAATQSPPEPEAPPSAKPAPAKPDADAVDPVAASIGATSVADVVAEAQFATEAESAPALGPVASTGSEPTPISAEQVDEVLTSPAETPLLATSPAWVPVTAPHRPANRVWSAGAALAVVVLGVQIANHYRSALAANPAFGSWTERAYSLVGIAVVPRWDVRQYEILDWVANAEPNTRGVGSLKISARIQNRGSRQQPYPKVQLRLKDRWEKAVGSRVFAPSEYLSHDAPHAALMAAGETARAEIELVDPGPDAYGFELDVCIEVEAATLTCRGDKVFL
jgi:predicted Zn finger-like uncharacterized protein